MRAAWIAEHYGWRAALVPSVGMIALLTLLVWLLAIDRLEDIQIAPYGDNALPPPPRQTGNMFAISIDALRIASGSLVFRVLTFIFFVCGISSFGLMPHL
jgi:hypothetical protein